MATGEASGDDGWRTGESEVSTEPDSEEEALDEAELQRFVLVRGSKVFMHDPFYVSIRTKKSSRLFGRKEGKRKYEKVWKEKLRHAKGQLIPKPYDETLHVHGDQWVPIHKAEELVSSEVASETQERFDSTLKSLLRQCRIFIWDPVDKEAKETARTEPGLPEATDDDPSFFLNLPQEELMKGPPIKGATVFSVYNGHPLVVGPSGVCFALKMEKNQPPHWYVASVRELTLGVAKRVTKEAVRTEMEDTRRWRKECEFLKDRLEELTAEMALLRAQKQVPRTESVGALECLSDGEIDDPDKDLIVDVAKAMKTSAASRSIMTWGKDSKHLPMDWLRLGVNTLRSAGISGTIMWEILMTRLEPAEAGEMINLKNLGQVYDMASFKRHFKERFCTLMTPMQRLREIQRATMTSEEYQDGEFYRFGSRLKGLAHNAYKDLHIAMEHWSTLDSVVVVLGFLNGLPSSMAADLLKQKLVSLEQHMKEASFLRGVEKDTGTQGGARPKWINGVEFQPRGAPGGPQKGQGGGWQQDPRSGQQGGQGGGQQGQQDGGQDGPPAGRPRKGPGRKFNKPDQICPWCRVLQERPKSCRHCRWCGEEGHFGGDCTNPKKEPPPRKD